MDTLNRVDCSSDLVEIIRSYANHIVNAEPNCTWGEGYRDACAAILNILEGRNGNSRGNT